MKISISIASSKGKISDCKLLSLNNAFAPHAVDNINSKVFQFCSIRPNNLCCFHCCHQEDCVIKSSKTTITTEGEGAFFIFFNGNPQKDDSHLFLQCKSCGKRFNLFYTSGKQSHIFDINDYECKDSIVVLLSKKYVKHLINDYPRLFNAKSNVIQHSFFPLLDAKMYFSYNICHVIEQMQNNTLYGDATALYMESKIIELLAHIIHVNQKKEKDTIQEDSLCKTFAAKKILENQYNNPPTIHQLAVSVGSNDTNLKKEFKELFNTTIYGYVMDYRMEKARKMLNKNKLSILDIALKIGYQKQANFATAFKKKYGVTPSEYMKGRIS